MPRRFMAICATMVAGCLHQEPKVSLPKQIFNAAIVVEIVRGDDAVGVASGSVFEGNKGQWLVVTAYHVVNNPGDIIVAAGADAQQKATIFYEDPDTDFAVLNIEPMHNIVPMPFNRGAWTLGETVHYVGHPNMNPYLYLQGSVAGVESTGKAWVMQGFAWFGSSGAAVFDSHGGFLGVVSRIDGDADRDVEIPTICFVPYLTGDDYLAMRGIRRVLPDVLLAPDDTDVPTP